MASQNRLYAESDTEVPKAFNKAIGLWIIWGSGHKFFYVNFRNSEFPSTILILAA